MALSKTDLRDLMMSKIDDLYDNEKIPSSEVSNIVEETFATISGKEELKTELDSFISENITGEMLKEDVNIKLEEFFEAYPDDSDILGILEAQIGSFTKTNPTRSDILDALAEAIQSHCLDNAEVTIGWSAIAPPIPPNPSPLTDPTTSVKTVLEGLVVSLTTFKAGIFDSSFNAFESLKNDLVVSFSSAYCNLPVAESFLCSPPIFLSTAPNISSLLLTISNKNTREEAFEHLAGEIVDWVTGLTPLGVSSGIHTTNPPTHAPFTGSSTTVQIA